MDSTDRNYFIKLCDRFSTKKSPVEKESIERQHETARQALMGKTPRDYTLLFQRGPVHVPTISSLQYFATLEELQKGFEVAEDNYRIPFGQQFEVSGKDSHTSMKYSVVLHSCPWAKEFPYQLPEGSVSSQAGLGTTENDVDQDLRLLQAPTTLLEKPSSHPKKHSVMISYPGSNTKPVLPPIPHGRQ